MQLSDFEHAVQSVCLAAQPPESALAMLGDRDRWLLYRELVRDRIRRALRHALRRTCRALPPEVFERLLSRWLASDPPSTRRFHGLPGAFAGSALPFLREDRDAPAFAADLLQYEAALWEVSDLDASLPAPPRELSFDAVPVLSPALALLRLRHAVHEAMPPRGYPRGDFHLCVHRGSDLSRPRTWVLNATSFALLQHFRRGELTLTEAVKSVAIARGLRTDARFLDKLSAVLAELSEAGVLLGSRS